MSGSGVGADTFGCSPVITEMIIQAAAQLLQRQIGIGPLPRVREQRTAVAIVGVTDIGYLRSSVVPPVPRRRLRRPIPIATKAACRSCRWPVASGLADRRSRQIRLLHKAASSPEHNRCDHAQCRTKALSHCSSRDLLVRKTSRCRQLRFLRDFECSETTRRPPRQ